MRVEDREAVDALARRVGHVAAIAALIAESQPASADPMLEHSFSGISDMLQEVADRLRVITDVHAGKPA